MKGTLAGDGRIIHKNEKHTYDRFVFFSLKQKKGDSVESFYERLIEQAENFSLGDEQTTLIRDTFILNMPYQDTHKGNFCK